MKQFIAFILLALYVVGVIGGIGYSVFYGGYLIAVGIVATAYLAFPKAKELFEILKP